MLTLVQWTSTLLAHLGVVAIYVVLAAEALGIPAPSEIVLLLSGLLVAQGRMGFVPAVATGAFGSLSGATVAYWLARVRGRPFVERRLQSVFHNPDHWGRLEALFLRHASLVVIVGRVLTGVRLVVSYPAGLFRMPLPAFLTASAIGALIWPLIGIGAGWYFGPRVMQLLRTLHKGEDWALAGLVVAGIGAAAWWRLSPRWRRTGDGRGRRNQIEGD
jgi:membrane protein DedA with SNARE-associated domain